MSFLRQILAIAICGPGLARAQGLSFMLEPPALLEFSNTTGAVLSCAAQGSPRPDVRWLDSAHREVQHVPRLREVLANGSLYFPPFSAEQFSPQVHATTYRCRAANSAGAIVSRDCTLRAHVLQTYEVQVNNAYVMKGNVAVLKCGIPGFVRDLVMVASWLKEDPQVGRTTLHPGSRFSMTSSGSLHVHDTVPNDAYSHFYCWVLHRLTGERRISQPGQIIVTEPETDIPPRIEHSVSSVSVKAGNTADLVCVGQGNPPPKYRWYREVSNSLQEVYASSVLVWPLQSVLQFPRAQPEDSARYVCTVSSPLGEDRREVSLVVSAPLSAQVRPQQQVADVGSPATFHCLVAGAAGSQVAWLRNGQPVVEDERCSVLQGGQALVIHSVRKDDKGMYQCVVHGEGESAQASGELGLGAVAPELVSTFIEQTLQPGPPVSLRCIATGNPPPHFAWLLDGGQLSPRGYVLGSFVTPSGGVVSHLNVSYSRVQHGGLYSCVARNLLGTARHSAALNIYGPPTARQPINITAVVGTDIYLVCPVAGYPVSRRQWERAGSVLPNHRRHTVFSNGTLLIRRVEGASDKGEYLCSISNQQGQTALGRVYLDIMKPPEIAPFQFPSKLIEGMRAQVSCSIISGDFPIFISWRKDGSSMSQDPDVQEQRHEFVSSLMFGNLAARHSGHYTCIASNAAATTNYTASLEVRVAPSWVIEPHNTSVLFQHSISLHCHASGYPTPTITWHKGTGDQSSSSHILESGTKMIIYSNGSMLIRAVDSSHEGYYICQASNGIGPGLSKVIHLKVNVPAHFPTRAANHSGVLGQSAVLECEAVGDPPLRVTWSAAGQPGSPGLGHVTEQPTTSGVTSQLHLDHLDRDHSGSYYCLAANTFGQDQMAVHLSVKEPPESPEQLQVVAAGSRWFSVAWAPSPPAGERGRAPVLHYVLQHRHAGGDRGAWNNVTVDRHARTARLAGLLPATQYAVRLLAVNEVGASAPTSPVLALTTQEAPSAPPSDVFVKATSATSVSVQWKPPAGGHQQGALLLGYKVGYRQLPGGAAQVRTVKGGSRSEALLSPLRQHARYEISVQAFNAVGAGPASPPLIVTTLEGVPDKPPQNVRCTALSSQSLRLQWEPPDPDHRNGVIEGYKISYRPANPRQGPKAVSEVKKTTNLETTLHGMARFTNYSVRALAFTRAGEGVRSAPLYCLTEQDVPGPPDMIKALAMNADSILVSWRMPQEPNGHIIKYYVYTRPLQNGDKEIHDTVLGNKELMYEARRLKEYQRYEFWVSAVTIIGEGPNSARVTQSPISRVPARIASFSQAVQGAAGRGLSLPCRAVGLPAPTKTWRGPGGGPPPLHRHRLLPPDHTLSLSPLRPEDAGNYSCAAENVFGRDEVVYALIVQVPPRAPLLSAAASTAHSLTLVWRLPDTGGSPITGYILKYKHSFNQWLKVLIDPDDSSYALEGLKCGVAYHLSLVAINAVGNGKPSPIITAATKGSAPKPPTQEDFLAVNSTSVTLLLETWSDGGCPLRSFEVEYRSWGHREWTLLTNSVHQEELAITDLGPATWYALRVTAHNDAGAGQQEYVFATRTATGELLMTEPAPDLSEHKSSLYSHLNTIVPVLSGVTSTIAVSVCVCIMVHRRQGCCGVRPGATGGGAKSLAELENQRNYKQQAGPEHSHSCQLYLPSPARKDSSISAHKGSETSGQDYEISPYATFNVPGKTLSSSQTMDYSLQFQTFTQRECYAGHLREPACCKDYCVHSSTSGDTELPHTSKSPPDGLSLGKAPAARHRRSDSDSSGAETSRGPSYQLPTRRHKSPRRDSVFELESSMESADGSPEVKYHKKNKPMHRATPR